MIVDWLHYLYDFLKRNLYPEGYRRRKEKGRNFRDDKWQLPLRWEPMSQIILHVISEVPAAMDLKIMWQYEFWSECLCILDEPIASIFTIEDRNYRMIQNFGIMHQTTLRHVPGNSNLLNRKCISVIFLSKRLPSCHKVWRDLEHTSRNQDIYRFWKLTEVWKCNPVVLVYWTIVPKPSITNVTERRCWNPGSFLIFFSNNTVLFSIRGGSAM
jgi:hypothetical protein